MTVCLLSVLFIKNIVLADICYFDKDRITLHEQFIQKTRKLQSITFSSEVSPQK